MLGAGPLKCLGQARSWDMPFKMLREGVREGWDSAFQPAVTFFGFRFSGGSLWGHIGITLKALWDHSEGSFGSL